MGGELATRRVATVETSTLSEHPERACSHRGSYSFLLVGQAWTFGKGGGTARTHRLAGEHASVAHEGFL